MKFNDKNAVLKFRLSHAEREKLVEASKRSGLSVSEILRQFIRTL